MTAHDPEPFDLNTSGGRERRVPRAFPRHMLLGWKLNAAFFGSAVVLSALAAYISSEGALTGLLLNSLTLWALRSLLVLGWVVVACLFLLRLHPLRDAPFLLTPVVGIAGWVFALTNIPFQLRVQASEPELQDFADRCLVGQESPPRRVGYLWVEKIVECQPADRLVTLLTSEGLWMKYGLTYAPDGIPRNRYGGFYAHLYGPWYRYHYDQSK